MKQGGFTLIELLIVVAIVSVLAMLVLAGAFPAMKNAALNAKCVNNLRQIGIGLSSFASDHDNKIMPRGYMLNSNDATTTYWHRVLTKGGYMGSDGKGKKNQDPPVFYCPAWTPTGPTDESVKNVGLTDAIHGSYRYGLRNWGNYPDSNNLLPLAKIVKPADFFLVVDSYFTELGIQGYMITQGDLKWRPHLRHGGKANTLFADWHVEAKDREYFERLHTDTNQVTGATTDGRPFYLWPEKGGN